MSNKLNNNQGLSPIARGMIARTMESFKTKRAVVAAQKAPHRPYGDFEESLGAEASVSHVVQETANV
jgi:hypothetical protein